MNFVKMKICWVSQLSLQKTLARIYRELAVSLLSARPPDSALCRQLWPTATGPLLLIFAWAAAKTARVSGSCAFARQSQL